MKTSHILGSLGCLLALSCATTGPTRELVEARTAYENARTAPQAKYKPDRVLEAKQALDRAERAHADDPGSAEERNLAYIATRRSELAVIYGDYEADQQNRNLAEANYKARSDQMRRQTQAELEGTRATLGTVQTTLAGTRAELEKARADAAAALASLEQVAKISEDTRGAVITLDGAVLFTSGKSQLLPIAKQKLNDVAKALNDIDSKRKISVEGHTDAQGNDASNLKLSQDRADAVRSYLVQQGVDADRISAVGKGETTPVASNDTAEGRANNRRVEIVVQNSSAQNPAAR